MAKDSDPLAGVLKAENTGGLFSGLLAEENEFDRRTLWRLGSWGGAAVGAVVAAVMANQAQLGWRRDQVAAADLARQAQQIQALTRQTQSEAQQLASAVETLNTDRDRLYSRVTVLEQGLDSVTGAIVRQNPAPASVPSAPAAAKSQPASSDPAPPAPALLAPQAAAPAVAPVGSAPMASEKPRAEAAAPEPAPFVPAPPAVSAASASLALVASKSLMSPPDAAASKLMQPEKTAQPKAETAPPPEAAAVVAAKEPEAADADLPKIPVQRTEFAVDLGSANSIGGLRALWRGLTKANPELAALRPIIMIRESNTGFGMQLRLGAGPLADAAAAAKICAALAESQRGCESTVFDGQRLAMKGEETSGPAATRPAQQQHRHSSAKRAKNEKVEEPPPPKPEPPSTLSSFFGRK